MQVVWVQTLNEGRALVSRGRYDCVILDWMLPDGSGVDLCSHIKATTNLPVILQTAKNQLDDKVE
jgi:DNA-binding response OmpR family regulator